MGWLILCLKHISRDIVSADAVYGLYGCSAAYSWGEGDPSLCYAHVPEMQFYRSTHEWMKVKEPLQKTCYYLGVLLVPTDISKGFDTSTEVAIRRQLNLKSRQQRPETLGIPMFSPGHCVYVGHCTNSRLRGWVELAAGNPAETERLCLSVCHTHTHTRVEEGGAPQVHLLLVSSVGEAETPPQCVKAAGIC